VFFRNFYRWRKFVKPPKLSSPSVLLWFFNMPRRSQRFFSTALWALLCGLLLASPLTPGAIALADTQPTPASKSPASKQPADQQRLRIVGSATVYPMVTLVAEKFGQAGYPTPIVESLGTGSGFKLFCSSKDANSGSHPAFANASRPIKDSERQLCAANGRKDLVEMPIGFDGIVLAHSKKTQDLSLSAAQLFLALADKVPDQNGQLVSNFYQNWAQIDAALPNQPIVIYGPPPSAGTRDALIELLTAKGCATLPAYAKLAESVRQAACAGWRRDGRFIEAGENYDLMMQKLKAQPGSYGLFGYSYFDQQRDSFRATKLNGVSPSLDSIADGTYPLARRLYVYADGAMLRQSPQAAAFAKSLLDESAEGEDGYLTSAGLVPLPAAERAATRANLSGYIAPTAP
jgi:phosphate transport system substrate-binding protein